ncbi:MAG TPA: acyl carrier protein [Candidatus Limnocylindrales bacterium]|nr:acyl carrier protein [Candidatus Limnocylindrales bacterium]
MKVLAEVRRFVHENSGNDNVPDDDDMFATGYVNSLFAIQMVMWLEQRFGVEVTGSDLDIANFRSISDVARLADRLAGGAAGWGVGGWGKQPPVEAGH